MGYAVDLLVLEMHENTELDSVPFVAGSLSNEATFYTNVSIQTIDTLIGRFCQKTQCKYRPNYDNYPGLVQRALRQLWLESEIAKFLAKSANKYDVAVAMESSIWLAFSLAPSDVKLAISSNTVLRSNNNDAGGYTNGLLLGAPHLLASVMSHFRYTFFPELSDYEHQLKQAFENSRIASSVLANSCGYLKSLAKLRHSGKTWGAAVDDDTLNCLLIARRRKKVNR